MKKPRGNIVIYEKLAHAFFQRSARAEDSQKKVMEKLGIWYDPEHTHLNTSPYEILRLKTAKEVHLYIAATRAALDKFDIVFKKYFEWK